MAELRGHRTNVSASTKFPAARETHRASAARVSQLTVSRGMLSRRTCASGVSPRPPARHLPLVHRAGEIVACLPARGCPLHTLFALVLLPAVLRAISRDADLYPGGRRGEAAHRDAVLFGPGVS